MRNTFIFLFIFLIFFTLVIFIFFNKNKINYNVLEYGYETKIYIDRDYIISNKSKFLINKLILQTTRHNNKKIILFSNFPVIIYRPTCTSNNNISYYNNWNLLELKVSIVGASCTHSKIYFKKFYSPFIILAPGGPIASDPIFIESLNDNHKIIILNKKKSS
jgi:hypothetical protein